MLLVWWTVSTVLKYPGTCILYYSWPYTSPNSPILHFSRSSGIGVGRQMVRREAGNSVVDQKKKYLKVVRCGVKEDCVDGVSYKQIDT